MAGEFMTLHQLNEHTKVWKAKLRVLQKWHVRVSKSGVTKFQNYILADEEGTKIQATAFGDDIPIFNAVLNADKDYLFSNGSVQRVCLMQRFVENTYQIIFNSKMIIETIDNPSTRTLHQYNFVTLAKINDYLGTDATLDIIAIAIEVLSAKTITPRASGYPARVQDIVIIDQAFITFHNGVIDINMDIPQAESMQIWKEEHRDAIHATRRSKQFLANPQHNIASAEFAATPIHQLTQQEHVTWVKGKIRPSNLSQRLYYIVCNKCNSRTSEAIRTPFICYACSAEESIALPRYVFQAEVEDNSGSVQLSMFGSNFEKIIGKPVEEISKMDIKERATLLSIINSKASERDYFVQLTPLLESTSIASSTKWNVRDVEDA